MMEKIFLLTLLLFLNFFQAQLNEKIIGKWQLNTTVTTEFTDSETSNKQVADNILKYKYLQDSNWTFNKDGKFEAKLKDGKVEKGSYSANEDRFLIIFDKESIEEFNTTNVVAEPKKVTLTIGRGMTKLTMNFEKK